MRLLFFVVLLSAVYINSAFGAIYYAQNGGTDNSCAQAVNIVTPRNSIANGISCLSSGDTLKIRAGAYNETIGTSNLTPSKSGVSYATATTVEAYASEVVTLNSIDMYPITSGEVKYIIFRNLRVHNAAAHGGDCVGTIHHIKFANIEVFDVPANSQAFAIGLNGTGCATNIWVTGGSVHNYLGADNNLYHCWYIEDSDNIIENAQCYNWNGGFGIHNYTQAGVASRNTYKNIWIHELGNAALGVGAVLLTTGSNNVAYNILMTNVAEGGSIGGSCTNCAIYNSTVYRSGKYPADRIDHPEACCYAGLKIDSGAQNAQIRNSIIYDSVINSVSNSGTNSTVSHNLTTGNPQFSNAAANDFNLTVASTLAIDQGIDIGFAFNGSAPDIGRYETATVVGAVTQSTSDVDVQVGTAYAPFTSISNCTGWGLVVNAVSQTISGCSTAGNGVFRIHCTAPCMATGNTIAISHGTSGITDSQGQALLPWNNFAVRNNLAGSSATFTSKHFRCRVWNKPTTGNTAQDWYTPEDTACKVQNTNGKIAVAAIIACTGGNCSATGFKWEFDVNSSGSWTDIDNSTTTNAVGYDNTQVGGAIHGASIPASLLSNPLTYATGWVQAQNSSFNVIDLVQDQATNLMASLQVKNGLTAGATQICVRPKQDNGAAISHDNTACFDVVNPGSSIP